MTKRYAAALLGLLLPALASAQVAPRPDSVPRPWSEVDAVPAVTNVRGGQFPKVTRAGRALFRVVAPNARRVEIRLAGNHPMTRAADGRWYVLTPPIPPGFQYYSVAVDSVAFSDPASESFYGSGRMSSGIEIPEAGVDFHELRDVPHGVVRAERYWSPNSKSWRRMHVYTPPGYEARRAGPWPVLYLHHGGGEDDRGWSQQGRIGAILDNLIAAGQAEPMIVAMPDMYVSDQPSGGYHTPAAHAFQDLYQKELFETIIPFMEARYHASPDARRRAIAGLSFGGGTTFRIAVRNPDRFSAVGVFSTSAFRGTDGAIFDVANLYPELLQNPERFNDAWDVFYISSGQQDPSYDFSVRAGQFFRDKGLDIVPGSFPGAHTWGVWRKAVHDFAQRIFKPVPAASPAAPVAAAPAAAAARATAPAPAPVQEPAGVRAASNVRSAQYPRVLPDRRAVFQLRAPEAKSVVLDLHGRHEMVRDTGGIWRFTTDPLGPGFHYYSLIIDGVTVADPASETFYGMSRMASGIEIPYDHDAFTVKDVPHGEVRIARYYSPVTQSWRRFYLYTPPGYDRDTGTRYPVLYILHGGGEDERGWATQGLTDVILDNLIAAGQAKPMLVAMLDGNVVAPGFGADFLDRFEQELLGTVIPFVERNYRVQAEPRSRALAGLSMGGIQTLHVGLRNADKIAHLGVFSSGWILPRQADLAEQQYTAIKASPGRLNQQLGAFYITMGGQEDIAYQNCQAMMKRFDELGVKYQYFETPGGHTWPVWRESLLRFAPQLFR